MSDLFIQDFRTLTPHKNICHIFYATLLSDMLNNSFHSWGKTAKCLKLRTLDVCQQMLFLFFRSSVISGSGNS